MKSSLVEVNNYFLLAIHWINCFDWTVPEYFSNSPKILLWPPTFGSRRTILNGWLNTEINVDVAAPMDMIL